MTLQPHLASVALKWKPAARGKRVPRKPSIVDGFCRLPSPEFAAGSVAPPACHLALSAARALLAALCGDAQNDSKRATIPRERADVGSAELWPRCGGPQRRCHDAPSD